MGKQKDSGQRLSTATSVWRRRDQHNRNTETCAATLDLNSTSPLASDFAISLGFLRLCFDSVTDYGGFLRTCRLVLLGERQISRNDLCFGGFYCATLFDRRVPACGLCQGWINVGPRWFPWSRIHGQSRCIGEYKHVLLWNTEYRGIWRLFDWNSVFVTKKNVFVWAEHFWGIASAWGLSCVTSNTSTPPTRPKQFQQKTRMELLTNSKVQSRAVFPNDLCQHDVD